MIKLNFYSVAKIFKIKILQDKSLPLGKLSLGHCQIVQAIE